MENATKALLIAAGVFLAIMLITLLMMGYTQISGYYKQQSELLTTEQKDKFNKQFQNYNRKDIRGNELISLMNKVIDYNTSESYENGTNYERIKVTISMGSSILIKDNFMPRNGSSESIISSIITNTNETGSNYDKDKALVKITNTPSELIQESKIIYNNDDYVTDTQLQKLTMELDRILIDENGVGNQEIENRRIRKQIIKSVLKIEISTDSLYRTQGADQDKMVTIRKIASQYYQYTQFKRAKFECIEMKHDANTGRVVEMNFKVQTKNQNGQEVVQFD